MPTLSDRDITRFWRYVNRQSDSCWEWTGARRNGYGALRVNGRVEYTHRLSYVIVHGDIPGDLYVLHECDNPACVRPDHLKAGTQKMNTDDMFRRGRANPRSGHVSWNRLGQRPLTPAERQRRAVAKRRAKVACMEKIPCGCGCGTLIAPITTENKPAKYALGHNPHGETTQFRKGQATWNKGLPMREESRLKMIEAKRRSHR